MPFISKRALDALKASAVAHRDDAFVAENTLSATNRYAHDLLTRYAHDLTLSKDQVRVLRSEIDELEAGTQYQPYTDRIALLEDALERLASTASRRQAEIDELKDQLAELDRGHSHAGFTDRIATLESELARKFSESRLQEEVLRNTINNLEVQNTDLVKRLGGVSYRSYTRRIADFEDRVERAASLYQLPNGKPGPLATWGWKKIAEGLRESLRMIVQ